MAKRGQSKYMPHLRRATMSAAEAAAGVHRTFEDLQKKAKVNLLKGVRGGDCNRTQCQAKDQAWWYNKTLQAFYCSDCAGAINEACLHKDHIMHGFDIYVKPPTVVKEQFVDLEGWNLVTTTADGQFETAFYATEDEIDDAMGKFCMYAGLRRDGTPPFHYSELPEKMSKVKTRLIELGLMKD